MFVHSDTDGFYAWSAGDQHGQGACGVTGEPKRAAALLNEALDALAPGATGSVRLVRLDRFASSPSYIYGQTLLRRVKAGDMTNPHHQRADQQG